MDLIEDSWSGQFPDIVNVEVSELSILSVLVGKPPAAEAAEEAEEKKQDKEDKPPVARIVAYSDSEGEDEPFLKRRRKKLKEAEEVHTEEEGEAEEKVPGTTPARGQLVEVTRRERRLLRAARFASASHSS